MKLINKLKELINPTICKKHKIKLQTHGWYNEKFCNKCFNDIGVHTYK